MRSVRYHRDPQRADAALRRRNLHQQRDRQYSFRYEADEHLQCCRSRAASALRRDKLLLRSAHQQSYCIVHHLPWYFMPAFELAVANVVSVSLERTHDRTAAPLDR